VLLYVTRAQGIQLLNENTNELSFIFKQIFLKNDGKQMTKIHKQKESTPFYFCGFKFMGLEGIFRDIPYAGYYTDKDLSLKQNAAEFGQAQYVLAPTILDLNNTDYEFLIFNCDRTFTARSCRKSSLLRYAYQIFVSRTTIEDLINIPTGISPAIFKLKLFEIGKRIVFAFCHKWFNAKKWFCILYYNK
jgi:hypothetical protein